MRDEGGEMKDKGGGMISGQTFTSCPMMLPATCLALGTSPVLWPGAPQGLTIRVLHLFMTFPRCGHHVGVLNPWLPLARCIFRALQCHSASSGWWRWSQSGGWSWKRSYGRNYISIPFPSTSSPTELPSTEAGGNTWSRLGCPMQPARLTCIPMPGPASLGP